MGSECAILTSRESEGNCWDGMEVTVRESPVPTGRTSLQKATSCRLHFKHSLNKCCHNRQAITDNNVSNLWIKNSLRIYWHWQTVAAFSLQLFTLSCASKTVTAQKLLCSLLGSKTIAGVKLVPSSLPPPRPP